MPESLPLPLSTTALPWLLLPLGYLLGSLPTGVLLGRLVGRDPRRAGSGNIGATNVTRTLGKAWGAVTLVVDVLKGLLPTLWAADQGVPWLAPGVGLLATVGHCYPVWLRFNGGKGVATAFGAMAALAWPVAIFSALLWIGVAIVSRIPAVGSLAAAAAFVGLSAWDTRPMETQLLALLLAVLILVRHRTNLEQLRAGRAGRAQRPRRTRSPARPRKRR